MGDRCLPYCPKCGSLLLYVQTATEYWTIAHADVKKEEVWKEDQVEVQVRDDPAPHLWCDHCSVNFTLGLKEMPEEG